MDLNTHCFRNLSAMFSGPQQPILDSTAALYNTCAKDYDTSNRFLRGAVVLPCFIPLLKGVAILRTLSEPDHLINFQVDGTKRERAEFG